MAFSVFSTSAPHLLPLNPRRQSPSRIPALPPSAVDFPPAAALAVLGGGSVAALAAALSLSDPDRRRRQQAEEIGGDDKAVVRDYFNNTGFQRWRKIYGEDTEGVNRVQLDIRLGHSQTVEKTLEILRDGGPLAGVTVLDAGCGTGSLAIPLAQNGALVSAADISAAMVDEARRRATETLPDSRIPAFEVGDLEGLKGRYHTVVCLDVLIHYPARKAEAMIEHLLSLAERRLVVSFAPKTVYYDLLKRVGELFPGPSKATRAYLHAERDVEEAIERAGWRVRRRGLVTTQFYFSRILEAVPAGEA